MSVRKMDGGGQPQEAAENEERKEKKKKHSTDFQPKCNIMKSETANMPRNEPRHGVKDRGAPAYVEVGAETAAESGIEDEQVAIEELLATVVEKVCLLARPARLRELLRVLTKPRLTLHEVLERLTTISWRVRCAVMGSLGRSVAEIDADLAEGGESGTAASNPLVEILAEGRALSSIMAAALGAVPPGGVWVCELPGGGSVGGGAGGAAGIGGGVVVCF